MVFNVPRAETGWIDPPRRLGAASMATMAQLVARARLCGWLIWSKPVPRAASVLPSLPLPAGAGIRCCCLVGWGGGGGGGMVASWNHDGLILGVAFY